MTLDTIDRVAVLGAGNMGHGITEVIAIAGYDVTMRDIESEFIESGYEDISWSLDKLAEGGRLDESPEDILARIETTTDLEAAVSDADLVIEAAPEELDLKHEIFADLDEYTHEDAILASNTSSLPITDIATATDRPGSVVGTHFFNPPVKMDLVEVIYGEETTTRRPKPPTSSSNRSTRPRSTSARTSEASSSTAFSARSATRRAGSSARAARRSARRTRRWSTSVATRWDRSNSAI